MNFDCGCGFHAELSAKQRERIAVSGGRVKCPKCGKPSLVQISDEAEVEPALATGVDSNSLNDLLGISGEMSNDDSEESCEPSKAATDFAPAEDSQFSSSKAIYRMATKRSDASSSDWMQPVVVGRRHWTLGQ